MRVFIVFEGAKQHGTVYAETSKEAIRFARMELFARGVPISDEGWYTKEVIR